MIGGQILGGFSINARTDDFKVKNTQNVIVLFGELCVRSCSKPMKQNVASRNYTDVTFHRKKDLNIRPINNFLFI